MKKGQKLPQVDEILGSTNPVTSVSSKQDKFKEIHTETCYNQVVQRQRQRETFESRKEVTYHAEGSPQ